ncbi:hypothetical protein [Klebsiella pneumoniae]|uniref:hypothetical protein n=1 Tax=Klebsiella pneumoniae TaxID=573 RepID=UPI0022406FD6|nr:hypothetical protein [Klebsiella pneumoniae]
MTRKLTRETLDDEALAELIAFRRSRVEYCQKEGLPYQKALHDSMMLALEELQERRKADSEPVVPVVPDFKKLARELVDNLVDCGGLDEGVKEKYLEWAEKTCRAAMLQAGNCRENANSSTNNCREIPETSTNRSREHFISLCNEFWNWSEMDEVCAEDRGYELRMEWDGKVFKHPVTQALWRMYHAAPQEVK